jgi:hypothetical protein
MFSPLGKTIAPEGGVEVRERALYSIGGHCGHGTVSLKSPVAPLVTNGKIKDKNRVKISVLILYPP